MKDIMSSVIVTPTNVWEREEVMCVIQADSIAGRGGGYEMTSLHNHFDMKWTSTHL